MEFEYRSIPLDQIDDADATFHISTGTSGDALAASIRHVGLINAPILFPKNDRCIIVSGFARIAACRQLGWVQIQGRCLPVNTPFLKCALMAVADNAGQREFNIVELARSLGLISSNAADFDEQVNVLQSLGLSVNTELVQMLHKVLQMSDRLQTGLIDGTIALPIALRLHEFKDADAAQDLAMLIQELRLGLNRQRELMEWLQGIAVRDDLTISEILDQAPLAQWRRDKTKDRGHISQHVRQYLRNRRYPEITLYEQRYARCLKALKLPANIHISAPANFEGTTYSLRLDFQNTQHLSELYRELRQVINSPALADLLSPTVSNPT